MKIILIIILLMFGCSDDAGQIEVSQLKAPYVFNLPLSVTIHPADEGLMAPPIAGRAYCPDRVIVEGYEYQGKLIIRNRGALGHEVANILTCLYPDRIYNHEHLPEPVDLKVIP